MNMFKPIDAKTPEDYIAKIDEPRRSEIKELYEFIRKTVPKQTPYIEVGMLGFGKYHYKYASGHEGDAPMIGFSPRKAAFSLYVYTPEINNKHLLDELGKFKITKACIYIKKLSDINIPILEKMCKASIKYLNEHHECGCRN